MTPRDEARAAALIARWAAQLTTDEDPLILAGCTGPLRALGYDLDALRPAVLSLRDAARRAARHEMTQTKGDPVG